MRLRLLDQYLLKPFLRTFALTALSAPLLFMLADVTARLDIYLHAGMTAREILLLYPRQFPVYMSWAFPIAALVATLFTLQPFVRHGELHAALAGGISLHRLFLPLIAGGAAASLVGVAIVEAAPWLIRAGSSEPPSVTIEREAFAYLTDAGDILSVENLVAGTQGRMTGVVLRSASADPDGRVRYIVAKEATWTEDEGWVIRHGNLWSIASGGEHRVAPFEHLAHPTLTERPRDLLEANTVDPASMSFRELGRFADRLERSGSPAAYPRTRQWERVTIPLTTLIIILFAAPLATIAGRGEGQLGAALSLVFTILYLALLRTSEGLGVAGLIHPGMAASIPALAFGLPALILFRRARS